MLPPPCTQRNRDGLAHGSGIWEVNLKALVPGKVSLLCCPTVKDKERAGRRDVGLRGLQASVHKGGPSLPASLGPTSQPPISPGPVSPGHCLSLLWPGRLRFSLRPSRKPLPITFCSCNRTQLPVGAWRTRHRRTHFRSLLFGSTRGSSSEHSLFLTSSPN